MEIFTCFSQDKPREAFGPPRAQPPSRLGGLPAWAGERPRFTAASTGNPA